MSFSGKYIAKMFSLNKFLVSECDFKLICFCERCRESDMFCVSVFAEKSLNRLVLVWLKCLHVFFDYNA